MGQDIEKRDNIECKEHLASLIVDQGYGQVAVQYSPAYHIIGYCNVVRVIFIGSFVSCNQGWIKWERYHNAM